MRSCPRILTTTESLLINIRDLWQTIQFLRLTTEHAGDQLLLVFKMLLLCFLGFVTFMLLHYIARSFTKETCVNMKPLNLITLFGPLFQTPITRSNFNFSHRAIHRPAHPLPFHVHPGMQMHLNDASVSSQWLLESKQLWRFSVHSFTSENYSSQVYFFVYLEEES